MIELKNVSFGYNRRALLSNVSLTIESNGFITITGANGSGKTTLALLLAGILKPVSGKVIIDGVESSDTRNFERERRKVGIVFENPDNQFITTSVERELAFGLENIGMETKEMRKIVEETLKRFSLEHLRFRSPHTLSGGEKQKVAIASILILKPKYIIFDEPTTYLDPPSRKMVIEMILSLKETISIILISHFPEEIILGDKIYSLKDCSLAHKNRKEIFLSLKFLNFLNRKALFQYTHLPEPGELCDTIESFKRKKSKDVQSTRAQ